MRRLEFVCRSTLAFTVVAALAPVAQAQNPFTIEGVVPDAGAVLASDPSGNVKELGPINGSATKIGVIHSASVPMLGLTNPNGQVDLKGIWTLLATANDGDQWFYFAWERDANTGSGFLAIEFQQAQLSAACAYTTLTQAQLIAGCNPWAGRQAGDFLILWDQSGNSRDVYKRVFSGTAPNLTLGPAILLTSASAEFSADGFRGEAAVDLTTDVFPQNGACVNYANTIPATVTGNSDTADYKDTVLALFPPISNCGSVTVEKATVLPDGTTRHTFASADFKYTLARAASAELRYSDDAANFPPPAAGSWDGDTITAITRTLHVDGDSFSHALLKTGSDYTLVEATLPSPWVIVGISCSLDGGTPITTTTASLGSIPVAAGKITACLITNKFPSVTLSYSTAQRVLLYDKITITNFYGTPSSTDVITFKLFRNDASCAAANQVYSEQVALGSDGTAQTTVGYPVTAATGDIYYWLVTYAGNTFNNAISGSCNVEKTTLTIQQ